MVQQKEVDIELQGGIQLKGLLGMPKQSIGIVIFVHGSGSGRLSPRNQFVAKYLQRAHIATLLFDLLTKEEEILDIRTAQLRFDISLLAKRLFFVSQWVRKQKELPSLSVGYFGASTGAAAALVAASMEENAIAAVVSRGGRPDLAGDSLPKVKAPTLLIVGEYDQIVYKLNVEAMHKLTCKKKLVIIPGATHLFEEEGTLEQAAFYACEWFKKYVNLNFGFIS
jgi:dienelactone hydrolase